MLPSESSPRGPRPTLAMPEPLRILAGDCTATDEDTDEARRERGNVLAITKLDNC